MSDQQEAVSIDTVLSHLPCNEARQLIFGRLGHKSLLAARCVSKYWQSLIDPMLDFNLALQDNTKLYVKNFGTDRPANSVTTYMFKATYPYRGLNLTDVKSLRISVKLLDDPQNFLDDKKDGRSTSWGNVGISENNCRRLLQDFFYVQKLHVASLAVKSFINLKALARIYLPNMKELIVTFFDDGLHQLLMILMNFFPSLKKVNIANVAVKRKERTLVYSWIFGFIARHCKQLEDVTLIFPEGMGVDETSMLQHYEFGGGQAPALTNSGGRMYPPLREHKMPQKNYEIAKVKLQELQLKTLIWDISMMEGPHGRFDMGTTLLAAQTHLSELHLDNLRQKDLGILNKLEKVLDKCSSTLTAFSIGGCFCLSSSIGHQVFNCAWLKNCTHLTSLEATICGMYMDSIEDLPLSIQEINLGHMLRHDQIEYIALHMVNLETWVLPQKGCLVNMLIPRINLYLFQVVLHLPKLTRLSICEESVLEKEEIMQFVQNQEGINLCDHCHFRILEAYGDLNFSIRRDKFMKNHDELQSFIANSDRSEERVGRMVIVNHAIENADVEDFLVGLFVRNLIDRQDEDEAME